MDPVTAICTAIAALANLETARLSAMSPEQRAAYLQPAIDAGKNVEKVWQDLVTRITDIFHPNAKS